MRWVEGVGTSCCAAGDLEKIDVVQLGKPSGKGVGFQESPSLRVSNIPWSCLR